MKEKLKILPLGGLREVGKNCMLLIYGKDALMIDCGMGFAGNDEFMDDDFFIPDFEPIELLNLSLKGVVITHGHEDHIGAVPYLLRKYDVPVYLTPFPAKILQERIAKVATYKNLVVNNTKEKLPVEIGPFSVSFFPVPHSIPEARGLDIRVGNYKMIHTGDFKLSHEQSPFLNRFNDVDILFIDSTNVEQRGISGNENDITDNLNSIIESAQGRVIATAFSSNIKRIKHIIEASQKAGRTVALMGRSVNQYTKYAQELGYITLPDNIITERSEIKKIPDNKLTLIVTGSQAEPRSIMKRMSLDMLKSVTVKYGDTIMFSSKVIPGNELSIGRMMDHLIEKGARLFYENTADIHVSGHAFRDELMQVMKEVNPRLVIPVHGHLRFLDLNGKCARELGYDSALISDGDLLLYDKNSHSLHQKIELDSRIVSNYNSELIDLETLRERKRIARAGFILVMLNVNMLDSTLETPPRLISSGISSVLTLKNIEKNINEMIYGYFNDEVGEDPDWEDVEEEIRILVRRYLNSITRKKPIVYSVIVNLDS